MILGYHWEHREVLQGCYHLRLCIGLSNTRDTRRLSPARPQPIMAPKGTKKKAAAAAAPAELAPAAASDFSLELRAGEVGRANSDYLLELEHALETINGHPLFRNMVGEEPHKLRR